jgi:subtilisin family serine protease
MDEKSALAKIRLHAYALAVVLFAAVLVAASPASARAAAYARLQAAATSVTKSAGATSGQYAPADSGFGEQWDLLNTGQLSGTAGDDVDATRAWDIEPGGNAAVTVGVVDSGVEFNQPSLAHANLYTQGAQVGGDGSTAGSTQSCAAASYGCSFVGSGGTPSDDNGHGTATAGEIFARWDEGTYAGVAPESTLIVAKVLDGANQGTTAQEAEGLDYVADRGARVVNVSIAGSQSAAAHEAIASHPQTLFVAAAGNAAADDDGSSASYPCADPSPNVICVAASDANDQLASFSNYGANTVDLAAPGVRIATLTREGSSSAYSGTSFAAPLVTGVAALAFALRPNASVAQVKQAILETVDTRTSLSGKTLTGGRLNAYRTLTDLIALSPAAPPVSTSAPTVSGTASIGGELSASAGTWSGNPSTTAVSWERCDSAGGHCQLIAGASGVRYVPTAADSGQTLRAEVLATNAAGAEIAFSVPTAQVGPTPTAAEGNADTTSTPQIAAGSSSGSASIAAPTATATRIAAPSASVTAPFARTSARVVLSVKFLATGSPAVRVLLHSAGRKAIALTVSVRIGGKGGSGGKGGTGGKVTRVRVVLARGASRALSIGLPRANFAARAFVAISGAGVSLKRSVAIG